MPTRFLVGAAILGLVVGTALAFAMKLRPIPPLAALGGIVALGFAALHVRSELRAQAAAAAKVPHLLLGDGRLELLDHEGTRSTILALDRRFGLTLLGSPSRRDLVLAITHRDGVEYLAARAPSGTKHLDLLGRAVTTPVSDLPIGDRVPVFADGDRLLEIVAALEARAPGALDRVFLSDAGMADVVLDERRLRAGSLDFDLRLPLFWRSYSFQEGTTFASHGFQATQIRQGDKEVVLVALASVGELATPSLVSPPPGGHGPLGTEEVQRALARDLRLAQGLADLPPPRAQRVAIDRLFMPRLRLALDHAPSELVLTPLVRAPEPPLVTPPDGVDGLRQSSPDIR
jgi:hypothetical protein